MKHENITQPDGLNYQVRVKRHGREYSRWFPVSQWRGQKRALEGARNWRDQIKVALGPRMRIRNARSGKPQGSAYFTNVHGVSRSVFYDRRKDASYLRFLVCWSDGQRTLVKTFQVGNVETCGSDEEQHAYRTAVAFRHEYEVCIERDLPFDPRRYRYWRTERLY